MREYLFRGKRLDNGEWVQGALVYDDRDKLYRIITEINYSTGTCLTTNKAPRVDASTICQCTGLKDKNGTKIFEGDICSFCNTDGELTNYEVLWFGRKWVVREANSNAVDDLDLFFCERSVVIGNIYNNPELLKGDNND